MKYLKYYNELHRAAAPLMEICDAFCSYQKLDGDVSGCLRRSRPVNWVKYRPRGDTVYISGQCASTRRGRHCGRGHLKRIQTVTYRV